MDIKIKFGKIYKEQTNTIVIGLFEGELLNKHSPNLQFLKGALDGFKAKLGQVRFVPTYGKLPCKNVALAGLGKQKDFSSEVARKASAYSARCLQENGIKRFAIEPFGLTSKGIDADSVINAQTEGIILGIYRFQRYKSPNDNGNKNRLEGFVIVAHEGSKYKVSSARVGIARTIADSVNWTRDLVNSPGNVATPSYLANVSRTLAKELKLGCRVLSKKDLERLNMAGILSVSKGSNEEPKFVVLEYKPKGRVKATIAFIGKGITFDAGGISLKPSDKLDRMKYDKSGACAVLGIVRAAAKIRLPFHLVGIVAACENLPSGKAYKPGDIIRLASRHTVEVLNTDAEGRLVLADALWYAKRYKPDVLVDIATLTGACKVALGDAAIGVLGNDRKLIDRMKRAGDDCYERVWELPLWDEYKEKIKSDIADIKNVAEGGAGAITAAAFLNKFVYDTHWAHLDIAGTAWMEEPKPYNPKGATGVGVRLIMQMLMDWDKS